MLTDDELTGELTLAFDEATQGLASSNGLGATVRRRHRSARRRSAALRYGVPAAAACAGGVAFATGGAPGSSHAPQAGHSVSSGSGSATTAATVAYVLKVPAQASPSLTCLDPDAVQQAHGPETSWVAATGGCTTIVIDTKTSLPTDAQPIDLAGVPGLYGRIDPATHTRSVYSRNADGGWFGLTVAADTPDESLRGYYVPSN
jgi:hypothetical protein